MAKVALVTDSTSYIPKDVREKYPITVVPQVVIWEGQTYEDDVTITPPPQNRAYLSLHTQLKQSMYPKRRTGAVNLAMTVVVNESQIREIVPTPRFLGTTWCM